LDSALRITVVSGAAAADDRFTQVPLARLRVTGAGWLKRAPRPLHGLGGEQEALGGFVIASAIGHVTPPVGLCLFVGMAISGLPMEQLVKPLLPLIAAIVVVLLLVAFVPETVLMIPRLLGFIQ